jgi:hypothetical protein
MSKLSKLINNPGLFFKDMINKRINQSTKKPAPLQENYNYNRFYPYTHVLHTGENVTGLSHLDLWIPYFKDAGVLFVVIIRNYALYNTVVAKYPELTILYAKGNKEINSYLSKMPTLRACFYPSNTGSNLHLLKFNNVKHIFIGHGDSDKTASAHKYFRVYDENWVAGEAHIDRFRNEGFDFDGLKQVKVGRPNLKPILQSSQENWRERFGGELRLLYLSTWEGVYVEQNYTSVYIIEDIFKSIKEKEFNIIIQGKLHPFVGRRDLALQDFNQRLTKYSNALELDCKLYEREQPVSELIMQSNIFICDISGVVTECLAANAPIFVYIPKDKEIKLTKSKMSYEDYTYTFSDVDELMQKMKQVLDGDDYLADKRVKAMEYILGKGEISEDIFIKRLVEIKDN